MKQNNNITISINIDGNYEVIFPSGQIAIHETEDSISNSISHWLRYLRSLNQSSGIKEPTFIEKLRKEFPDLILTMEDRIFHEDLSTIRSIFADENKIVSWDRQTDHNVSLEDEIFDSVEIEIQNYLNAKNENLV